MTAQVHPNVLGALSALADLTDQHRWLADLLEPGRRQRTARPAMSPAARAVADRQAKAERRDQVATLKAGLKPSGASKAPLDLGVLDIKMLVETTAHDSAIICGSVLRNEPMMAYAAAHMHGTDEQRYHHAVAYLLVALRRIPPDLAGERGTELAHAAWLGQQATGKAPDRRNFRHGPCPACGRDSLLVQTVSSEQPALVMCGRPDCKCRGLDCLCRRPFRTPGVRHVWGSDEFEQLRRRLEEAA